MRHILFTVLQRRSLQLCSVPESCTNNRRNGAALPTIAMRRQLADSGIGYAFLLPVQLTVSSEPVLHPWCYKFLKATDVS